MIRGPEKRCGKSRLLDMVEALCRDPLITVNAIPGRGVPVDRLERPAHPAGGRGRHHLRPEGRRQRRPARAAERRPPAQPPGHAVQRGQPTAWSRSRRSRWPPSPASAPCPTPSRTAPSSSGCAAAHPAKPSPPTGSAATAPPCATLAEQLTSWLRADLDSSNTPQPAMPVEDRAADTWEPLVAVADLAGGRLARPGPRGRARAHRRGRERRPRSPTRIRLLIDCRTAFGAEPPCPRASCSTGSRPTPKRPGRPTARPGSPR